METYGLPATVGFKTGEKGILPDRPTLVLFHGAGGSSQTFLQQLRPLDRVMNVLAVDLPGHGATPGPGRDVISAYADWVEEAFSSFSVPVFFLGGHSMGGAIAQELALRSWPRIRGLILIATGAELRVSAKIIAGLAKEPEPTLAQINKWCFSPEADPQLLRQSLELLQQTPIQVIYNDFQACNRFDRSENALTITLPTLILVGERDVMTPPAFAEALQKQILHSKLVQVPGAGHLVMLEKPKEVNQAIEAFISEVP
ncbi:MAG: alpha/beta hydrolase [Deltaproteobacteria bacterium]|nr:alpha/beta hydrolase [Deltaproteobacteria bacterium]